MDREKLRSLFDLTGRVAIVTGGTRGIGRAIAEGFVAAGAKVAVASRKADACEEAERALVASGGEAIGVPTHMGDLDALHALVDRTVDTFGGVDIVVNNAANALREDLGRFTPEAWAKSMDVNLRGPVFLVQEALPHLEKSPSAAVVNVISAGAFLFSSYTATYAAAKAGMMSFTRSMAAEYASARDPRERARARDGRHRHGAQQPARGAGAHGAGRVDAARRRPRRDGRSCAVPRLRRVELRHRPGPPGRRRARPPLTPMLQVQDQGRIRVLTLDRPDALNSFNEALYDAAADGLLEAAGDRGVAVVVLTGTGRAFSAGQDVLEMAARTTGADFTPGRHGFPGFVKALREFPKPLLCAVNGMALGIGVTLLAYADLVFMSTEARAKMPFTSLAVAPEAGSSLTLPRLLGRQHATWALLSSEWIPADECLRMGLAWRVCEPDALLDETLSYARVLASKPISSLVETKATIVAGLLDGLDAALDRENAAFARLLGQPANLEAFAAFAERREPNFDGID